MPAISVIMPVYNSEKYLSKAVDSVLAQTFENFELILIDDGSNDKSGAICDELVEKDKRLRVIHKKNGGICSARNAGLDVAKGEYIAFIDNDDEYLPNLLMDNYNLCKKYDADVVRFERKRIQYFDNGDIKADIYGVYKITGDSKILLLKDDELKKSFYKVRESGALFGIWNGIYKKKVFDDCNLRFNPDIKFGGEDVIMNLMIFNNSNSYLFNPKTYYIYNRRVSHSTSTKFDFNRIEALLSIAETEKKIINKINEINEFDLEWFKLQLNYVIEICVILTHKNCNWSYSQKRDFLKKVEEKSILSNDKAFNLLKKLYKVNKNKTVIGYLFYTKKIGILYYFIKMYYVIKNKF